MWGANLIAAERQRQVDKEGWSAEHDAIHTKGELSIAAACYAVKETDAQVVFNGQDAWPWPSEWDKRWKHSRLKQLVIAGALIAAEIDREISREAKTLIDGRVAELLGSTKT